METDYNKKIIERLKLMPKFFLFQEVTTPDGDGVIVELKTEWNGLYIEEERATAAVWYSTDEAANGWVSRSYKLTEISTKEEQK